MASYYNPSRRLSEWAAAWLQPYLDLERADAQGPASLSVGLWSGRVRLENVALRPEAFEQFLNPDDDPDDAAVRIRWKLLRGSIGRVDVEIPWKSLLVGSARPGSAGPAPAAQEGAGGGTGAGGDRDGG
jgi:hypothetical protein